MLTRFDVTEKKLYGKMKHVLRILAVIIAGMAFACASNDSQVREVQQIQSRESTTQKSWNPEEHDSIKGYPPRKRRIGGPTDVEWDLDNSFPKSGSLLELMLRSEEFESQ